MKTFRIKIGLYTERMSEKLQTRFSYPFGFRPDKINIFYYDCTDSKPPIGHSVSYCRGNVSDKDAHLFLHSADMEEECY